MTSTPAPDGAPLVDANLLLWAHHGDLAAHPAASAWWRATLSNVAMVGVPWPAVLAFLRVSTHPNVLDRPLSISDAWSTVTGWLERPNVWVPVPTERHPEILGSMLLDANATGNNTTDAHLAALAVEWGLELLTADRGFARYPGLRWRNPLES